MLVQTSTFVIDKSAAGVDLALCEWSMQFLILCQDLSSYQSYPILRTAELSQRVKIEGTLGLCLVNILTGRYVTYRS